MKNKPQNIIVHHSASPRDKTTFEAVNGYHRRRWNFKSSLGYYIGYHYFIEADGVVYQGRADTDVGAHTRDSGMNFKSIGICLAGNFNKEYPSDAQSNRLSLLLGKLCSKYNIPTENIYPHRNFKATDCYGKKLHDDWARNHVSSNGKKSQIIDHLEEALKLAKEL